MIVNVTEIGVRIRGTDIDEDDRAEEQNPDGNVSREERIALENMRMPTVDE